MPSVSVIVPAYNSGRTILETIASVQRQTFSDFELIVINDGSTDKTLELLGSIQDSRLKVFSYGNAGLPTARNRGIAQATGQFITFLDADDLWTPDKLELQVAALKNCPEAGAVYSWTLVMDEKGENFHPGKSVSFEGNVYREMLLSNFIASGSNIMLRRETIEAVGVFDSTLKSCEDWDYWLRVAPDWIFVVVPKSQILYRQSSGAMSSKIDVMDKNHLIVIEKAFEKAPPDLKRLKNQSLSNKNQFLAQLCLTHVSGTEAAKQAFRMLYKSIKLYPKSLLSKSMRILTFKLLLILILSPERANSLLKQISRLRAAKRKAVI
ncbi:glycosyltransferase family 2 protein [Stenomitos frigidus]|uniref:Glycosyl transferase family A n=1 Tax=Stenomitos frigidus ULC18 TaxID=2107698 RepID=A0A2T1ECW1_9CYAN|nr:glycosyltransferase family 2 protein [Stenomitos frigidus]PSB30596.1 glycosyl transferase family A [Stenomitos frigidus ULC18]